MPGKFGDLAEYFNPGLTLTILGREYEIPLPSAELGLWCRRVAELAGSVGSDATEEEAQEAANRAADLPDLPGDMPFTERLLGVAYRQMVANGVPDPYVQFAGQTVYLWIVAGEDTAARFWQSGGSRPESEGPGNRAQRRAATSTSTAAANGTRSPASTSGTSSRKRSGRRGGRGRSPGATS